jgi:hypothetical protein
MTIFNIIQMEYFRQYIGLCIHSLLYIPMLYGLIFVSNICIFMPLFYFYVFCCMTIYYRCRFLSSNFVQNRVVVYQKFLFRSTHEYPKTGRSKIETAFQNFHPHNPIYGDLYEKSMGLFKFGAPMAWKKFENFFPENDPFSIIFNEASKKRTPEA